MRCASVRHVLPLKSHHNCLAADSGRSSVHKPEVGAVCNQSFCTGAAGLMLGSAGLWRSCWLCKGLLVCTWYPSHQMC